MTKESNEANNTSVDHPILIWLVSIVCILIAGLGAVMAVLNDQTVSELRSLNSEIARLEGDRNQLREELESDEFKELLRIKSEESTLRGPAEELQRSVTDAEERKARIENFDSLIQIEEEKERELRGRRNSYTTELNKLEQKENDLKSKADLIATRAQLKGEVARLQSEVTALEVRQRTEKNRLTNLENDVITAMAERDDAERAERAANENKTTIQNEITLLRADKSSEIQLQTREDNLDEAEKKLKADQEKLKQQQEELTKKQARIETEEADLKAEKEILKGEKAQYQSNLEQLNLDRKKILEQEASYRSYSESIQNALNRINQFNNATAKQLDDFNVDPPQINFDDASTRLQEAWSGLLDRFVEDLIENVKNEMSERTAPLVAPNEGTEDNTEEGN